MKIHLVLKILLFIFWPVMIYLGYKIGKIKQYSILVAIFIAVSVGLNTILPFPYAMMSYGLYAYFAYRLLKDVDNSPILWYDGIFICQGRQYYLERRVVCRFEGLWKPSSFPDTLSILSQYLVLIQNFQIRSHLAEKKMLQQQCVILHFSWLDL